MVGVVSCTVSNTLIRPLFSATNTRASEANATAIRIKQPMNSIVVSSKPRRSS